MDANASFRTLDSQIGNSDMSHGRLSLQAPEAVRSRRSVICRLCVAFPPSSPHRTSSEAREAVDETPSEKPSLEIGCLGECLPRRAGSMTTLRASRETSPCGRRRCG